MFPKIVSPDGQRTKGIEFRLPEEKAVCVDRKTDGFFLGFFLLNCRFLSIARSIDVFSWTKLVLLMLCLQPGIGDFLSPSSESSLANCNSWRPDPDIGHPRGTAVSSIHARHRSICTRRGLRSNRVIDSRVEVGNGPST